MTEYRRTKPRDLSERLYRFLLYAYPRDFRDEFGDAMVEFHRDRLAHARRERGMRGTMRVWGHVVADLLRNGLPARVDSIRRRGHNRVDARAVTREDLMLSSIVQDIRFALRGMRRTPGFTFTVLAMLALGIGASVATFSAVNGVLLKPLPFRDPERLVRLQHLEPYTTVSEPEFVDYRRDAHSLETIAAYQGSSGMIAADRSGSEPERVRLLVVTDNFFGTLGTTVMLGRTFSAEEERRGGPRVVMISHGLWMRRFGGDSAAIGKEIILNDRPRTVVGVLAPGAEFPSDAYSVWLPKRLDYDSLWTRNNHYLTVIGRLATNATATQAAAEVRTLARRMTQDRKSTRL